MGFTLKFTCDSAAMSRMNFAKLVRPFGPILQSEMKVPKCRMTTGNAV